MHDKLADMRDKGEFVKSGQHDILTEALGTPKHLGHVKTKGEYVTQREVFKKPIGGFKSFRRVKFHLRGKNTGKISLRLWKIAFRHRKVGGNKNSRSWNHFTKDNLLLLNH